MAGMSQAGAAETFSSQTRMLIPAHDWPRKKRHIKVRSHTYCAILVHKDRVHGC